MNVELKKIITTEIKKSSFIYRTLFLLDEN